MSFELITLRFYHGGVMKIGKKGYKGKPYHGGEVYEFLDVDIDRSTAMLEIKSNYDTTLIAECLSHGDILDCFVCHFIADPVLVSPSLKYGESGVGVRASQNSRPNASFDAELEPTHEAQENASNLAPANSNTSSPVHSFTAPNTPPPTHQTPTLIHPSSDPTLDPVHSSSDLISDTVHPSNEQDSDRESLNGGFNGSDVDDELRSFREEKSKRKREGKGEKKLHYLIMSNGNNQMLPLAWAVVEVENKFTWNWFVNLLKEDLQLGDGTDLIIISDMQKGLKIVITDHLPNVEHKICVTQILANWSKRWRSIERKKCFWRCARSTFEAELKDNISYMKRKMPGRLGKKRKKEKGETSKTEKLSKRGIEMSCITCNNKGHNKRKCPLGASASGTNFTAGPSSRPAAGPSSRPPSGPSSSPRATPDAAPTSTQTAGPRATPVVAPTSTQTVGPRATPNALTGSEMGRPKVLLAEQEWLEWVYYTHKVVLLLLIERFRNVKSSAVVTGDLGHKPTCGVKWKGKQAMTSSQLEEMRGRKQM
ncbi:hypothetical protein KY285_005339 [Solanum tuberosum]|nr:hypothetical protein KY285_005339 [Solanum tuberosum]